MIRTPEGWRALLKELRPEFPPPDMAALYVRPRRGCAAGIVREFDADPSANTKFLLVGARGGGKSTELRAISQALAGRCVLVEVDLDRSGVTASSMSAFDLLYVCSLALLKAVPPPRALELYGELTLAYAGDQDRQNQLGELDGALKGISDFAAGAAAVATAAGFVVGAAPAIGAVALAAREGLRLLPMTNGVVPESSPKGRALQTASDRIARSVRESRGAQPICVLVDGLERMNGEAGERFRQVFEQTRLIADARWTSVIAAPPCTLTQTSSVDGRGYCTRPVWGFGPDDLNDLAIVLERRFSAAGLDPRTDVEPGLLERIAERSGGLPRHAIQIAREACNVGMEAATTRLQPAHVEAGIRAFSETLGRGLTAEHLRILRIATRQGPLPDRAATLFADGRILAYPPQGDSIIPRFSVHPLLRAEAERYDPGEVA